MIHLPIHAWRLCANRMLIPERQSRLKELLAQRGMSNLDTLAEQLGVSQSTIRRDLEQLEHAGLVNRTHGGVVWIADRSGPAGAGRPYAFDQRMAYQVEAKRRIARVARRLVPPGQTVLIDGGTTTFYFAQELLGQPLQIVTNSLPIADVFLNDDAVELILTGGLAYPRYGVLLGPMVESALATIHTQRLFLSVAGIHEGNLYNQNVLLVQAERRMMQQAQEIVLLVDHEKFGRQALSQLCPLSEIDLIVTDEPLTADEAKMVQAAGCRVIVAPPDDTAPIKS